ncbi:hypothetical protein EfmAA96_19120 [Enterococcus faecium]|nr:hypothetical protein EfmAA96_19120 [Enterococcus faecium]
MKNIWKYGRTGGEYAGKVFNCTVERHVSIQTKAHLEDGSQTFTHGDVVDMFDDVSVNTVVQDGSKEAFETILYALLPDNTTKEIWKSGKIDYEVNDKEFTKTVLAEKVDTSKYPEGTSFTSETLLNLTSFKRKYTTSVETVGGPIDVLAITPNDAKCTRTTGNTNCSK